MVRYKLNTWTHIWTDSKFTSKVDTVYPSKDRNDEPTFVDILERTHEERHGGGAYKVRVFLPFGRISVGWIPMFNDPISIHDIDLLLDGRFNSDKIV